MDAGHMHPSVENDRLFDPLLSLLRIASENDGAGRDCAVRST